MYFNAEVRTAFHLAIYYEKGHANHKSIGIMRPAYHMGHA